MPIYCVNKNVQANGDHEVHDLSIGKCTRLPETYNRLDLGYHPNCQSAVQKAKSIYWKSNGCYYCCPSCHTS
ncbi:MAG: hypothetical protein E6Q87_02265 [Cellvibrionales bacterium]|nr:MAG: hypothetical protein E6Q87_02265 [Cellvibrionales bacterium]